MGAGYPARENHSWEAPSPRAHGAERPPHGTVLLEEGKNSRWGFQRFSDLNTKFGSKVLDELLGTIPHSFVPFPVSSSLCHANAPPASLRSRSDARTAGNKPPAESGSASTLRPSLRLPESSPHVAAAYVRLRRGNKAASDELTELNWDVVHCPYDERSVYIIHRETGRFLDSFYDEFREGPPKEGGVDVLIRAWVPPGERNPAQVVNEDGDNAGNLRWRLVPCPHDPTFVYIVNARHGAFVDTWGQYCWLWNNGGQSELQVVRGNTSRFAGNIRWRFSPQHDSGGRGSRVSERAVLQEHLQRGKDIYASAIESSAGNSERADELCKASREFEEVVIFFDKQMDFVEQQKREHIQLRDIAQGYLVECAAMIAELSQAAETTPGLHDEIRALKLQLEAERRRADKLEAARGPAAVTTFEKKPCAYERKTVKTIAMCARCKRPMTLLDSVVQCVRCARFVHLKCRDDDNAARNCITSIPGDSSPPTERLPVATQPGGPDDQHSEAWEISATSIEKMQMLGSGTYGEVFSCRVQGLPGKFAVKRVRTDKARESLQRELDILCNLRHPNIVSLVGYAKDSETMALVMELYADSLKGVMQKRTRQLDVLDWFDGRTVLTWLGQIAQGLAYLHDRSPNPIAHRDIKTENCLVELAGLVSVKTVLLTDFGISKAVESSGTLQNTIIGTPGYIAPEALTGKCDPLKADVYAFGVLALALLSNLEPSEMGQKPGGAVWFPLSAEAEKLTERDAQWAWIVKEIYESCAAVDSSRRPTAAEVSELIEEHVARG